MDRPAPDHPSARAARARAVGRGLAVTSAWLLALGIAAAGFSAGSSRFGEAVLFGFEFAVASAMAAVVALAVAGRGRWAAGVALATFGAAAIVAVIVGLVLWAVPWITWRCLGMGSQDYIRLRWMVWAIAGDSARSRGRFGLGLGIAAGALAGLTLRLARRRPWLALGAASGLVLAVGALAESAASGLTDLVVESRLQGGVWKVAAVRQDEITSALGGASGAIVGAIAAGVACRTSRGRAAPSAPAAVEETPS